MPAHQLGGKNECATAAEEAARVAFACGVFREGLTPKFRVSRIAVMEPGMFGVMEPVSGC